MKIAIGSDHAGFDLKQASFKHLKQEGYQVEDVGAYNAEPAIILFLGKKLPKRWLPKQVDRGIVVCGNGIGMSIVANKVPGVRAALVFTEKMAEQTRTHNDSNVLSLAGRDFPMETNLKLADIWLKTPSAMWTAMSVGWKKSKKSKRRTQICKAFE